MPTIRAASAFSDNNSRSSCQVGSLPTGTAAGDLVVGIIAPINAQTSFTMGSAAVGWNLYSSTGTQNNGNAVFTSSIFYKVIQAGDTFTPNNSLGNGLSWNSSGKYTLCMIAVQPDAGQTFDGSELLGSNVATLVTTAGTSFTPPSYAAGSDTGLSVIFHASRASATGATAITTTPPTNWTEPASGDTSTNSGTTTATRQICCAVSTRASQTGTITPGSMSTSLSSTHNSYHLLIKGVPPPPSSFPTVVNSASTNSSATTSQALNMPGSIVAGNLLLAHAFNNPGGTPSISGWTQVGTHQVSSTLNYTVFAKIAAGGDTGTITYGASASGGTIVYQVENWSGSIADVASAFSSNAAPGNPPSLNMGSSRDHLWFAGTAGSLSAPTGAPANYTNLATGGTSTLFGVARRELTAASEDPGAFTGGTGTVITGTTGVPPLAAVAYLPYKPRLGPNYRR